MPIPAQRLHLKKSLATYIESLYVAQIIDRKTKLQFERIFRSRKLMGYLATGLYGPEREISVPGVPELKFVLLSMREVDGSRFNLPVLRTTSAKSGNRSSYTCLVGHRFTPSINKAFRLNIRELFGVYNIKEYYSGFDGAAINIIDDLRENIRKRDFCFFDNRETTAPSKPNVYIEAGMAFALRRPFIFSHYKQEVWPADFSNTSYIPYGRYRELFRELAARLPIFLATKVKSKTGRA